MLKPGKQARVCETSKEKENKEKTVYSIRSEMCDTLVYTQRYYPKEGQQIWKRQTRCRKLLAIIKLE